MKSLIIIMTIAYFFCSCASNIYTINEIRDNKDIYSKVIEKKVEIIKNNTNVIKGYFIEIKENSVVVCSKKNCPQKRTIAIEQIKYLKLTPEGNPAVLAAVVSVGIIVIMSASGMAKGISNIK